MWIMFNIQRSSSNIIFNDLIHTYAGKEKIQCMCRSIIYKIYFEVFLKFVCSIWPCLVHCFP